MDITQARQQCPCAGKPDGTTQECAACSRQAPDLFASCLGEAPYTEVEWDGPGEYKKVLVGTAVRLVKTTATNVGNYLLTKEPDGTAVQAPPAPKIEAPIVPATVETKRTHNYVLALAIKNAETFTSKDLITALRSSFPTVGPSSASAEAYTAIHLLLNLGVIVAVDKKAYKFIGAKE